MPIREKTYKYSQLREEDGSVYSQFIIANINIENEKEFTKERLDFTKGKDALFIVDGTLVKSATKTVRDFLGSEEGTQKFLAVSIYVKSKISVYLANFFLKVNLKNKTFPIKMFSNEKKALEWLQQFM